LEKIILAGKIDMPYVAKPSDYMKALKENKEFFIQFNLFKEEVEAVVIRILHRYLEQYDILYLRNTIITGIKELINNSIKANIKRIYFSQLGLNIDEPDSYRKGMESFKKDIFEDNIDDIFGKLNDSKFVVRVSFQTTEKNIYINIINNTPIITAELDKINSRIEKAYRYKDISEAFDDVLDDSEGAGLGLIMVMMLFKNSGLGSNSLKVHKKNELTISTVTIPKNVVQPEAIVKVTEQLLKEIDELPAFPENIRNIQNLCNNPESTIKEIADNISKDPGLTSSILKLANSAGYITTNVIDSINDAVKVIGIKGINSLLLASGVHKIMDSRYKKFESIWNDSYKRAFYAQKLSIQMKASKNSDFAYLAGLLADIGEVVFLSIDLDGIKRIKEITGQKNIEESYLLEEISVGISHGSLGELIGEKWNFNEGLRKAIGLHHRPYMVPKKYKQLVYIVYLAEVFVQLEKRKIRFELVDEDVLKFFNLTDKETFDKLHAVLKEFYD
jgi:HD-like signal output (HDOD) protein